MEATWTIRNVSLWQYWKRSVFALSTTYPASDSFYEYHIRNIQGLIRNTFYLSYKTLSGQRHIPVISKKRRQKK
jgi:hypothetical protein